MAQESLVSCSRTLSQKVVEQDSSACCLTLLHLLLPALSQLAAQSLELKWHWSLGWTHGLQDHGSRLCLTATFRCLSFSEQEAHVSQLLAAFWAICGEVLLFIFNVLRPFVEQVSSEGCTGYIGRCPHSPLYPGLAPLTQAFHLPPRHPVFCLLCNSESQHLQRDCHSKCFIYVSSFIPHISPQSYILLTCSFHTGPQPPSLGHLMSQGCFQGTVVQVG